MKKFYIFDFDGTLVNTFYDSVIAYNNALRKHGQPEYEYDCLENVDYTDFTNKMTENMDILVTYAELLKTGKKEHTGPYPQVKKVLKQLVEEKKELAICSNRMQDQLIEYTQKFFKDIPFTHIIGYTPDGGFKPQPRVINKILDNTLYKKDEIVYVGDKMEDIQTARNVDLDVVIVTWGQGNHDTYKDKYPIKIIDNIEELMEL